MEEIWKPLNDKYHVSSEGRVKSFKRKKQGRILSISSIDNCGYLHIRVDKTYLVHRLVAALFIPNPENKPHVNHKDGNKANNRADNLEWVTISENLIHAFAIGLMKPRKGSKSNFAKINQTIADNIKQEFNPYLPKMIQYKSLSKNYGISERQVRYILSGNVW